jgi:hypothetical protein
MRTELLSNLGGTTIKIVPIFLFGVLGLLIYYILSIRENEVKQNEFF